MSPSTAATPTGIAAPTAQGAAAFARFYLQTIADGFRKQDAARVSVLSDPNCKTCRAYIDSIRELKTKHYQPSQAFRFDVVLAEAPATNGSTARVDVIFNTPAVIILGPDGHVVQNNRATKGMAQSFQLHRVGDAWRVKEITA